MLYRWPWNAINRMFIIIEPPRFFVFFTDSKINYLITFSRCASSHTRYFETVYNFFHYTLTAISSFNHSRVPRDFSHSSTIDSIAEGNRSKERRKKVKRPTTNEYCLDRRAPHRPNWIVRLCETRAFRAIVGPMQRASTAVHRNVCAAIAACTRVTRGTHSQQWRCVGGKVLLIANTANISATSDAAQRCAIMRQLLTRLDYAVEVASTEPRFHGRRLRTDSC